MPHPPLKLDAEGVNEVLKAAFPDAPPDARALVVEDVVSTGGSLLRAVERLRELEIVVVAATALLDRSPRVAERFAAEGIPWLPLVTWADLGIDAL